ncbi:MAG: mobilization protein [Allorhizobium sp.]
MRRTIHQRLSQIEARRQTLKARLGKLQRTEDTRRKILIGALVLHRCEHGTDALSKSLTDWLRHELPGFLTRDTDRQLFAELLTPDQGGDQITHPDGAER